MQPVSDTELLLRLKTGEKSAFGPLYERYRRRVYGYCLRMLRDTDRAQDMVQAVFLKALESAASLERPEIFTCWLFTIARNEIYSALRRSRTGQTVELQEEVWESETPHDIYVRQESAMQLESALARLKPEYREVLILQHLEQLTYGEIAAVTGETVSSVESRLFRARKALVRQLGPYMPERRER